MQAEMKSRPQFLFAATLPILLLFGEAGFPRSGVKGPMPVIEGAKTCLTVKDLRTELGKPDRVLVWRHGSTFPAELWPTLQHFLKQGGSLVYLGGAPFTRPVAGKPGERKVQPRTVSYLKALRLNQAQELDATGLRLDWLPRKGERKAASRVLPVGAQVYILEPRLSEVRDFSFEDGGSGARDAQLRPLAYLHKPDGDARFPVAAGALLIDRWRGPFAGGRWTFWLCDVPPQAAELVRLLALARMAPVDMRIDPAFACFHEGERPSAMIRIHRPRARKLETLAFDVELRDAEGKSLWRKNGLEMELGQHGSQRIDIPVELAPGLYRLSLASAGPPVDRPPFRTGFWVYDDELFRSGDKLEFDAYTMRRKGRAEPVIGTTLMSKSVHRKFLFEPNAAEWDASFGELASLGINMVRTGIWTGQRKISMDPGVVDEGFVRALEAYYLSARRHGIPVMFTFFAFMPEAFGGANPYLDPRAIEGQRAYLSQVAQRFRGAKEMLWDLINEPSFSNPSKLWQCRPKGDEFEKNAFLAWLKKRYGGQGKKGDGSFSDTQAEGQGVPKGPVPFLSSWEDRVRARWRLRQDESLGLPLDGDFNERGLFGGNRPYRAREYCHFAQDAFGVWIHEMSEAIRQAGSRASITVGQDEGGLYSRPGPLFHHARVDYTSLHSWWNNDALLWDGILAKATGKPLLVSETGVMGREDLSGTTHRSLEASAALLSRKIGYAFAAGAFGVVQWCYDTNPYMDIDNEVAIGLKRVDGSVKPEHAVLRRFAAFFARNRQRFDGRPEPETVLLVPSHDSFPPRALGPQASRALVTGWSQGGAVPMRAVSEYRTATDLGQPRTILLPSCSGISDQAWNDIEAAVRAGATLVCSGWFEADDSGLPAPRLGTVAHPRESRALMLTESTDKSVLRFSQEVVQSIRTSRDAPAQSHAMGKGRILHHPLPVDLAQASSTRGDWYASTRRATGHSPEDVDPALFLARIPLARHRLVILINKGSRALEHRVEGLADPVRIPAGRTRMMLLDSAGQLVDRSH